MNLLAKGSSCQISRRYYYVLSLEAFEHILIDLDSRKKKFVLNYDVTQFKVDFLNDFVGIHAAQFDFVYIIIMMVRFVRLP